MEFRKVLALRGPNIWANFPVLEAWVDLGELKDRPSNEIPGFNDRLMSWMPTMIEHRCSIGERGGFFQRLRNGTYPGHILEHVTLELQTLAGTRRRFRQGPRDLGRGRLQGHHRIRRRDAWAASAWPSARESVPGGHSRSALRRRGAKSNDCANSPSRSAWGRAPGPSSRRRSARGIPYRPAEHREPGALRPRPQAAPHPGRRNRSHQRHRRSDCPGQGNDPHAASRRGRADADGRPVKDADDAWEAAEDIGVPVVVKPQDGNQGRGVATNLTTREQVVTAYEAARKEGESVIVEKFAPGHDYRLLVVGDRVVAAARREPAQVVGDGVHTVAQLVEQANADPRRGEHHATVLSKIKLDAIALAVLADQGLTPDSVPAGRHDRADPPQREPEHRRHGHRRHRARASGRGRLGGRCGQDRRAGHRRRRRGRPRHLPAAWPNRAA